MISMERGNGSAAKEPANVPDTSDHTIVALPRSLMNSRHCICLRQRARAICGEYAYFAVLSFSFCITSSILKLAAFCRCGKSLNVSRNWPT